MSLKQYVVCKHSITEIEGENICINCGLVSDRVEVQSTQDWKSHSIKSTVNPKIFYLALKITQNLHLPQFALNTVSQVSSKLILMGITKKNALLYGLVYACRTHNIPRLLSDIIYEMEKINGTPKHKSEKSLLKILNRISKVAFSENFQISPPDKIYYLQAYLAKIQSFIENETSADYFNSVRIRSEKIILTSYHEPSTCARNAILQNVSSILKTPISEIINN